MKFPKGCPGGDHCMHFSHIDWETHGEDKARQFKRWGHVIRCCECPYDEFIAKTVEEEISLWGTPASTR